MTGDRPPPTDDADRELSSLFATLKDDQAPPDLEARILAGLAAAAVVSGGAAAAKVGVAEKIALWLGTSGLGKSMLVGALCGGAVCGAITVVDSPQGTSPPAGEQARPAGVVEGPPLSGAREPVSNTPYSEESNRGSAPPGAAGAPGPGAPSGAPVGPGEARSPSPASISASPSSSGVAGGSAESAAAPESAPVSASPSPSSASDELRRELLQVRGVAALVDGGRCAEARAAIAAYRSEHRTGQLTGEVDVLAARCQGR